MTQDDIRVNFLLALDRADVNVSAFEASFIDSNLARFSFSPKQRKIIDRLMAKYEKIINFDPDRNKLTERAAKEEAQWNRDPLRIAVKAPKPTVQIVQPPRRSFMRPEFAATSRFAARPRPPRPTAHVNERLVRSEGQPWRLSFYPVKPGTLMRNGTRMEDHWIDYATGTFNNCPFLEAGDVVEYDHYTDIHG